MVSEHEYKPGYDRHLDVAIGLLVVAKLCQARTARPCWETGDYLAAADAALTACYGRDWREAFEEYVLAWCDHFVPHTRVTK
jgi:hypothetical protein